MGYPEDTLAPEEELILHAHPHWKMLFWPAVVFVSVSASAGFLGGVISHRVDGTAGSILLIIVAALWTVLVIWRCIGPLFRWKTTHFVITDRRVLIRHGVLTHTGIDIPMKRISSVQFRHGLFDRMLGTGTLVIDSSSQEPLEYDDIPHVERVHSLLYHQVFEADDSDPSTTP